MPVPKLQLYGEAYSLQPNAPQANSGSSNSGRKRLNKGGGHVREGIFDSEPDAANADRVVGLPKEGGRHTKAGDTPSETLIGWN